MIWNWQQADWPHFTYDRKALDSLEAQFLRLAGESLGAFKHVSEDDKNRFKVELISEEALQTSKIEGEILDRDNLQSSIGKQFGIQTDHRRIPPAEQGIAAMMVDLYKSFDAPLTHDTLFEWHRMLMNGRQDLCTVGAYRTHADPMQVVSGAMHDPTVHFEAPPSSRMAEEMEAFIEFFEQSREDGPHSLAPESLTCISFPFTPLRMATGGLAAPLPRSHSPKVSDTRRSLPWPTPSSAVERHITTSSNATTRTPMSLAG